MSRSGWAGDAAYRFLYVDFEGNLPTGFSAMLLAACAVVAAGVACMDEVRRGGWTVLAAGFLAASVDEAASLHELLVEPLRVVLHDAQWLRYPLIVPGSMALVIAAAVFGRFLRSLPASSRRALVSASGLFVFGALGLETVGGWFDPVLYGESIAYASLATAEKACEMGGASAGVLAMLRHIERYFGPVTLHLTRDGRAARS